MFELTAKIVGLRVHENAEMGKSVHKIDTEDLKLKGREGAYP